jgi:hypothetical protein
MFIWTFGDVIGVALLGTFVLICAAAATVLAVKAAARRIRRTFRNLWSRFHG